MSKQVTIIGDVEISWEPCRQCGEEPSGKDIQAVFEETKKYRENEYQEYCPVCNKLFVLKSIQLVHYADRSSSSHAPAWGARGWDLKTEPVMTVNIFLMGHGPDEKPPFQRDRRIHEACFRKVFPHWDLSPTPPPPKEKKA